MKKIVPDPPRLKLIISPHFSAHSDMTPPDSLTLASEFLSGVIETLETHCSEQADAPDPNAIASAAHATKMARTLVEHALSRL
ncbi:hypothetical protein CCOS865_05426 [Pseudomonas reidholzensis]|uniref:DUF3077 domain-containing protein n=1 Tax=Pseudomonas reidholzensis TaxID=1785162 RepID=A0A383S1F7_9PSED|nr:hypothetical protein [Pseudomonas reidholzensis]SYX93132.1 hypothetical protein CCOS865_05426 [Pseudomonas reidholzensis]